MPEVSASRIAGMAVLVAAAALAMVGAGCPGSRDRAPAKPPDGGRRFTLFALAEVRGQIEPCGCTTDPLGDIARTVQLVADARASGPVLVVDAGSLLYSQPRIPPHLEAQEQLKSDLLVELYAKELQVAAIGLGPADLANGPAAVRPARQAANVAAGAGVPVEAPRVIEVGGAKVGVFGVVSAELARGIEVGDPVAAATEAVKQIGRDADVVVALLTMTKKDAVRLLKAVDGIDIAVLGMGRETPEPPEVNPTAEAIGEAWLVIPANRGQVVSRLDITVRGDGPLADAIGPAAAEATAAKLDERLAALDAELARFAGDPSADPAFVKAKQQERADLGAERDRLRAEPLRVPAQGSWFTLEQVRIRKALACDAGTQAAKQAYSQAAGAANVAAAKGLEPVPPGPGQAGYVGIEECESCHAEAVEFWNGTRHAQAWETLEVLGKQFDYECTSCHVTGWDQPGGATMGHNDALRDVQCETCHGPGSLHVEAESEAQARATIRRAPPEDLCAGQCHTSEHSDTFDRIPYLRDVLGPGHGEQARQALGDGVTGRELRAAGLERAGKVIGAGCVK